MLNIGVSELTVIFLVAYIIVGPKDMAKVLRSMRKAVKEMRSVYWQIKKESGWDEMMSEPEIIQDDTVSSDEEAI